MVKYILLFFGMRGVSFPNVGIGKFWTVCESWFHGAKIGKFEQLFSLKSWLFILRTYQIDVSVFFHNRIRFVHKFL